MRHFLIAFNGIITVFFLAAFIYTFVGKAHLTAVAREFAAHKTAEYSEPMIDLAEEASQSPLLTKLLPKSKEQAIASEFSDYRDDPSTYIAKLVGNAPIEEIKLPKNSITEKIAGWKEKIRDYYDKVLGRITNDLRIFTGTNLVAGLIAFLLAARAKGIPAHDLIWLSGVLCLATCISIYCFADTFSFYQYLFNWHMGWSYPLSVAMIYLYLLIRLRNFLRH